LAEINQSFKDLNTIDTRKARHSYFKVEGSCEADYAEHIIDLSGGDSVMCGIRHFGGDKNRPFISLEPSFLISSKDDVERILKEVGSLFEVFKPQYASCFSRKCLMPDMKGNIYFAQLGKSAADLPSWPLENSITLKEIGSDDYYDWYQKEYEEFHSLVPGLANRVLVNAKEVMEDSRSEGLLYEVLMAGERVGIIAAERSSFLSKPGIYFNEIYLCKNQRGKGLAKIVQKLFIKKFSKPDEIIWGTIDSDNLPSQRTAMKNKRRPVRFENFFTT
jgi:hypothetical protein